MTSPASSSSHGPATSLITAETVVRVSSTLDKSVGKKYLTDGSNETCWSSSNGLPQSITLTFPRPINPSKIILTFAGGFVGTVCTLSSVSVPPAVSTSPPSAGGKKAEKEWTERNRFFPEDVNRRQSFELAGDGVGESEEGQREWKIEFEKSSDFFGRITVYELEVWGWEGEV